MYLIAGCRDLCTKNHLVSGALSTFDAISSALYNRPLEVIVSKRRQL